MTKRTTIETTITAELTAQDVYEYVKIKKIAPEEWIHYSVELIGKGVSEGATLKIKHTEAKPE